MRVLDTIQELTGLVDRWLSAEGRLVLAVEGASLSGKTTLARRIADRPDAIRISTDCYYVAGRLGATYSEGLELDILRHDIEKLRDRFALVVIEGVCLRDTLQIVGVTPDRSVYVKRLSQMGVWNDDPELGPSEPPQGRSASPWIEWWSREYHLRTEPHSIADVCFERTE